MNKHNMRRGELLGVIRALLLEEKLSTQDEIQAALERKGHPANQSSISRALKKLGVVKALDSLGKPHYQIPLDNPAEFRERSLNHLVVQIQSNATMIVVRTTSGSAQYLARYLDSQYRDEVLGTIAGDDTIFVAPRSVQGIPEIISKLSKSFGREPQAG